MKPFTKSEINTALRLAGSMPKAEVLKNPLSLRYQITCSRTWWDSLSKFARVKARLALCWQVCVVIIRSKP